MQSVSDFPWEYAHVTKDTLVRTGQGVLHSIVLNGLTTAGDATIYDNTAEAGDGNCGTTFSHYNFGVSPADNPFV